MADSVHGKCPVKQLVSSSSIATVELRDIHSADEHNPSAFTVSQITTQQLISLISVHELSISAREEGATGRGHVHESLWF